MRLEGFLFVSIVRISVFLPFVWLGFGASPGAFAENGDVLSISEVLSGKEITDITFDLSANPIGGSFWAVGRLTGKIYHLSADLSTLLGEITNPHGIGSIPNFILTWGVAYRATTSTLFVLAQDGGTWRVKEVRTSDGTEVTEGAFTITPENPSTATLRGLKYDTLERQFWYLDTNNDKVYRVDSTGVPTLSFSLPGDEPPECLLRGEGLSYEIEEVAPLQYEPRIYVAYGDIFRQQPSRIIQMKTTGETTGMEVPLTDLNLSGLMGFQTYRLGLQRRIAVVSTTGKIAEIEHVITTPPPPSSLHCALTLTNQVALAWQNHGSGADGAYGGEILLMRNSVPFATLPGDSSSFTDATPVEGTSTYSLQASDAVGGAFSAPSFECEVTVGTSGIMRWVPFAGSSLYDIASDPATGDIFVTDNVGMDGQGTIYHYDAELNLLGEIPSPWERPGGIAFVPAIVIQQVTLTNVLAVGRTDGVLVKFIDLTGAVKTSIPFECGEATCQIGGLAYLPDTQEFAFVDPAQNKIVLVDKGGRLLGRCETPVLLNLPAMELGITYDPVEDTFLTVFADGVVREVYPGFKGGVCVPSDFDFGLESLGEGATIGGIQIIGNTLYVCRRDARALFQILIYPYSPPFVRGDFDRNDAVNIGDVVAESLYLFRSGTPPTCMDAADANDDAVLDVSDPIYLLFHLFLQGSPPPAPFPMAGDDPTFRDNLGCES